jgi:hypothetical protein
MKCSSRDRTRLLTAVLVACAGSVLLAKTQAPTIFELAYTGLALYFDAPELCEKIAPDTVEHGPIFGHPEMKIRYVQSKCFFDMAHKRRDPALCTRVRTISRFWRNGSAISEGACLATVKKGPVYDGGTYATGLLLGVMGYSDDDIRKEFPDHPAFDRSYDFMYGRPVRDLARKDALRPRLALLPDFSRGDAAAKRQLYAAVPHCASGRAQTFECRRLRCALERAQPSDLGCERDLQRERRNPWR